MADKIVEVRVLESYPNGTQKIEWDCPGCGKRIESTGSPMTTPSNEGEEEEFLCMECLGD